MSRSQDKSVEVMSQRQLQKMTMILADRWSETCEIIEIRNSTAKNLQQHSNLWIEQISL